MLEGVEEQVQLLRLVRPVGIHLADHVVALVERPGEPVQVGGAEATLGCAVQHVHPRVCLGQLVGDPAGAIG